MFECITGSHEIYLFLFVSESYCLCLSVFLCVSPYLSVSVCLSLPLSVSLSLYLCVCLCLYLSLCGGGEQNSVYGNSLKTQDYYSSLSGHFQLPAFLCSGQFVFPLLYKSPHFCKGSHWNHRGFFFQKSWATVEVERTNRDDTCVD